HRRTRGRHESGAFLLGHDRNGSRQVENIVYYDELDPRAYSSGIVILHAPSFGKLWDKCGSLGLSVVADVHVHELDAGQSTADRRNPMIAQSGHIALILPNYAKPPIVPKTIGFYEYAGNHQWRNFSGQAVGRYFR